MLYKKEELNLYSDNSKTNEKKKVFPFIVGSLFFFSMLQWLTVF